MLTVTRRELLRTGFGASAAFALGCGGGAEQRAPELEPLRLTYGGFAMGIQSFSLRHYTLEAALDITRALGLARIELIPETALGPISLGEHFAVTSDGGAIDAVLAACVQRGVAIAAHGVNGVASEQDARGLFAFARRARVPVLTIAPEPKVLGALDSLCAEQPGVQLAIHNHGPGMAWETIEEIEGAIGARHPSFGACVDTGHFIRSGIDPIEALRRFGPRLHGVHLKDFVSEGAFADGCILGAGKLDLAGVFRALREIEFRGALSLEYEKNADDVVPDLVACLRAASLAAERVANT